LGGNELKDWRQVGKKKTARNRKEAGTYKGKWGQPQSEKAAKGRQLMQRWRSKTREEGERKSTSGTQTEAKATGRPPEKDDSKSSKKRKSQKVRGGGTSWGTVNSWGPLGAKHRNKHNGWVLAKGGEKFWLGVRGNFMSKKREGGANGPMQCKSNRPRTDAHEKKKTK